MLKANVQWRVKNYFLLLYHFCPATRVVSCLAEALVLVHTAWTSDIHLGQELRKKKIIRRRENIVQKNVIRNCLVGNLYRKMCEVVCKRFEAEFLFFCVLLDNYFVSYIRWWIGMFESQSLTVLASTRRFLQQSYFSLNFQFFPEKKNIISQ